MTTNTAHRAINESGTCHGVPLIEAAKRLRQIYEAVLGPCGLSVLQRAVLLYIHRSGRSNLAALSDALAISRSALTYKLKPLELGGYVIRVPDGTDGQGRMLILTPLGKAKLNEANELWCNAQDRFEMAYGPVGAGELRTALSVVFSDQFAENFEAILRTVPMEVCEKIQGKHVPGHRVRYP